MLSVTLAGKVFAARREQSVSRVAGDRREVPAMGDRLRVAASNSPDEVAGSGLAMGRVAKRRSLVTEEAVRAAATASRR